MRLDLCPLRSAAVSLFEVIDTVPGRPGFRSPRPQLPLYVEPAADEALLSWLLRLASRLQVSFHALASYSFGIEDRSGRTRWWCYPHPWVLARIGERTGVNVSRLRPMTFNGFAPIYRDDEASARFVGRRYDNRGPQQRGYRFAICGQCLEGDATPYLRSQWLFGWLAVCPHHGTILIERCGACGASLRAAPFATEASFSPADCPRCGESLLGGKHLPAHPSVIRMQTALLRGKCEGMSELHGLGEFRWPEMIAFADVLLGMVWTDLTMAEQEQIFRLYGLETSNSRDGPDGIYDCRHGSLHFLAWLTEGWPDSAGATVGRRLLARWLAADRNRLCRHLHSTSADPWTVGPTNFEPPVARRLTALASSS
jgi:TniQ